MSFQSELGKTYTIVSRDVTQVSRIHNSNSWDAVPTAVPLCTVTSRAYWPAVKMTKLNLVVGDKFVNE